MIVYLSKLKFTNVKISICIHKIISISFKNEELGSNFKISTNLKIIFDFFSCFVFLNENISKMLFDVCIYPTPPPQAVCDTRSVFKCIKASLNQFLLLDWLLYIV